MRRCALLLVLAAAGCAEKSRAPSVVRLPEGLSRRPVAPVSSTTRSPESDTPKTKIPPQKGGPKIARVGSPAAAPARAPSTNGVPSYPAALVPRASAPSVPKADEIHRLGYRTPGGNALEVEGVCRFDESSVACWNGEGKPADEVKRLVESSLSQGNDSNNLQIRYGMKNRILVLRQTTMPVVNGQGERRSLSVMGVGPDPRYGGYVNLQEASQVWQPNAPQVRHEARVFAVEGNAPETQMRVMVSEPIEKEAELRLHPGATASLNGCTFRVLSISPAAADASGWVGGSPTARVWSIKVAQIGKQTRPASFHPHAPSMAYVDRRGKLVARKTFEEWERKRMEGFQTRSGAVPMPQQDPYGPVNVNMRRTVRVTGEETEIVVNADPKALGKVVIGGSYLKTVDVTGIPLDPR